MLGVPHKRLHQVFVGHVVVIIDAAELKLEAEDLDGVAVMRAGFDERRVHAQAGKAVLQVQDGLVVFPVGLHDHALDGLAGNAPDIGCNLLHMEGTLALLATPRPHLAEVLLGEVVGRKLGSGTGTLLAHHLTNAKHELVHARTGGGGHAEVRDALALGELHHAGVVLLGTRQVALVAHDDGGALSKLVGIHGELGLDDLVVVNRVTTLIGTAQVDDVHDEGRALHVAQELVAQTLALAGALDEAGDVRDDVVVVLNAHHAEVGLERGEGVVGNLGAGGAHIRDERRLADTGHADKAHVGHELHLELDQVLIGGLALLGECRSATHGRAEMGVAPAAMTAFGNHDRLAVMRKVGDLVEALLRLGVKLVHNRAKRHGKHDVGTVGTVALGTLAMRAAAGLEVVLETVVDERGALCVGLDDNVATAAAVAAVGAAFGNMGLAAERHAACAAVAALGIDVYLIDEQGGLLYKSGPRNLTAAGSVDTQSVAKADKDLLGNRLERKDVHATLVAGGVLHRAIDKSEQGVVLALAHVLTGVELGAMLTNEDGASGDNHAVETLAAKTLADRIAAVTGSTRALLMCHDRLLNYFQSDLLSDLGNAHLGEVLAMATLALVALTTTELVHDDLLVTVLLEDLALNANLGKGLGVSDGLRAIIDEKNLVERDGSALFDLELLDVDDVALGNLILLTTGLNNCVHVKYLPARDKCKFEY